MLATVCSLCSLFYWSLPTGGHTRISSHILPDANAAAAVIVFERPPPPPPPPLSLGRQRILPSPLPLPPLSLGATNSAQSPAELVAANLSGDDGGRESLIYGQNKRPLWRCLHGRLLWAPICFVVASRKSPLRADKRRFVRMFAR